MLVTAIDYYTVKINSNTKIENCRPTSNNKKEGEQEPTTINTKVEYYDMIIETI